MHDIFISYAKEDATKAKQLISALEKIGFSVWYDFDIPTGETFDDTIEKAIKNARCVIVLWSKNSIHSEWVRIEAAEGKKRDILVPVILEDVEIPLAFRRRQAINIEDWLNKSRDGIFERLVEDIQKVIHHSKLDDSSLAHDVNASSLDLKKQKSRKTKSLLSSLYSRSGLTAIFVLIGLIVMFSILKFQQDRNNQNELRPKGLVFASQIETNGEAINPGSVFSEDISDLYAVFRSDMVLPGMDIKADSIRPGSYYAHLKTEEISSVKTIGWRCYFKGDTVFNYTTPVSKNGYIWLQRYNYDNAGIFAEFGPGKYKVVILIDGNPAISSDIIIKSSKDL